MASVVWTRTALADLRRIRAWIAADSPHYAEMVAQRIRSAVGQLAQFPESGRIVPERTDGVYRELIVPPYRVVYRYAQARDVVTVITAFHGNQRFPALPD